MRSVWMQAHKGIFKHKSYTAAIFFLTLVAAVCIATGLSTIFRTQQIYDTAYNRSHSPDQFYLFKEQNYSADYIRFFKQRAEVSDVSVQPCLYADTAGTLNGHDVFGAVFSQYVPSENNFAFSDGARKLTDHSAYLPLVYQSQFGAKIGDSLLVKTGNGDAAFTVAGFFEDPVFGSTFMGTKRVLLSADGYRRMSSLTLNRTSTMMEIVNVYFKPTYQGAALEKTAEALNRAFGKDTLAVFQTDRELFYSAVLIIPNLAGVVLLCFSGLLLFVILLVLRHAILSSIEADYVSLGVLKAIGFTGRNITTAILVQYLTVVACGAVAGIVAAMPAVPAVAKVMMASTGILGRANLTLPAALGVPAALLVLCGAIATLTAHRSARISPVRAIAYGKAPVQFSSRLNPPLARMHGLPLWLRLPAKQMAARLRQYTTLVAVAALFTFMLSTLQMLTGTFSSTNRMARVLGQSVYDISVSSVSHTLCPPARLDAIVQDINATYGVKQTDWTDYQSLRVGGHALTGVVMSNFNGQKDAVLEGSAPAFSNEIAITPLMSRILGKSVGDTVVVQKGTAKQTYMITCILQNISEMGKTIEMNEAGYKRLVPDFQPMSRSLLLKNAGDIKAIIAALKQKYPAASGVSFTDDRTSMDSVFSTVSTAVGLSSAIVIVLTLLLIACITLLLCTITIFRETIDTGIFKAIGFRTMELRVQFTLRFAFLAAFGGAIGTVLSLLFANPLVSWALSNIGIASIPSSWGFQTLGFPLLFMVCVSAVTAFLCSARVRRLSPARLISE